MAFALEAAVTEPVVSGVIEVSVLGHLEGPALAIGSLVASLTPPVISAVIEDGVLGHRNLLTPIVDALESSVALPHVFEVDEGMLREVRRGLLGLLDGLTLVFGALETSLTGPVISRGVEVSVLRSLEIPEHAYLDFAGNYWICDRGFKREGNRCSPE